MLLFITLEFYGQIKLSFWLLNNIDGYNTSMSNFLFYSLLIIVGIITVILLCDLIAYISIFFIRRITRLLPERKYAVWFTRIYSIIFCLISIFQTFSAISSVRMIPLFIFMAIIAIRMVFINISATNESLLVKEFAKDAGISEAYLRAEIEPILHPKKTKEQKETDKMIREIKRKVYEMNKRDALEDENLE